MKTTFNKKTGIIKIEITPGILASATELGPLADEFRFGNDRILKVFNKKEFAKEVYNALLAEDENGDTLLTKALDAAISKAVEYSETIEFGDRFNVFGEENP